MKYSKKAAYALMSCALALMLGSCNSAIPTQMAGELPPVQASLAERVSWLLARPELQDAVSQKLIQAHRQDVKFVEGVELAYLPSTPQTLMPRDGGNDMPSGEGNSGPPQPSRAQTRLTWIRLTALGSVANYDSVYANKDYYDSIFNNIDGRQIDWSRDGCSAPGIAGLGYTEDFRGPCNVHDFGYGNFSRFERLEVNRLSTDNAFLDNMRAVCAAKPFFKKPGCYTVANVYWSAVRLAAEGHYYN